MNYDSRADSMIASRTRFDVFSASLNLNYVLYNAKVFSNIQCVLLDSFQRAL